MFITLYTIVLAFQNRMLICALNLILVICRVRRSVLNMPRSINYDSFVILSGRDVTLRATVQPLLAQLANHDRDAYDVNTDD